jgi:4-coumarate--CoA ligase
LLLQALHRRIKLVVMPKFTLEEFCRAIQDYKVSLTYVAPPVLVQLTRSQLPLRYDLSSLRMITCGAAPLGRELVAEVYSKLKLRVNQAYGLSETSPMTHTQVSFDHPLFRDVPT